MNMKAKKRLKEGLPYVQSFQTYSAPCIQWAIKSKTKAIPSEALCRHQCGCTCLCPIPPCLKL